MNSSRPHSYTGSGQHVQVDDADSSCHCFGQRCLDLCDSEDAGWWSLSRAAGLFVIVFEMPGPGPLFPTSSEL